MRALVRDAYGPPDSLELRELPTPVPGEDEVLVRVRAASVNPVDWYDVTGTPYISRPQLGIRRPKSNRVGSDFAGEVEAVGSRSRASLSATRSSAPGTAHSPSTSRCPRIAGSRPCPTD